MAVCAWAVLGTPAFAQQQVSGDGASPIPLVLLRRSAKPAPDGSAADVLVRANPTSDDIAKRVAVLASDPNGFTQFALRLDRAVRTYLTSDPKVQGARRRVLSEPAYLFLSDRQGGFPAEHFWLEMPDGSLQEKKDVPFVDTVVGERDLVPGTPDGVEAIYAHELAHLLMAALAGPAPKRATSETHFITVRTDAWTAFVEGFGEHMQPMSLDHYPRAAWQAARTAPMPPAVVVQYERFVREQVAGCWICPANLAFLRWHGRGESWLRDGPVRVNLFARPITLPSALTGDGRPAGEVRMYRDVVPRFGSGLKNGQQMLESEGVIATLFYRLASDEGLRAHYRDTGFYERFVPPGAAADLMARGPAALFSPAENVYLKMFDVLHTTFAWSDWPAVSFVKAYAERFPDEAGAVYDVFLAVTHGVTVAPDAGARSHEPGYLTGLRDSVLAGSTTLDAGLGAPLWVTVPGFRLGMGLFRYFPIPNPYSFDLNAADVADLRQVSGVDSALASAIIAARDRRGWFGAVDDVVNVPGVTPELLARFKDMRARMVARLNRPRPAANDAGAWQNYLVTALRASYWLAAAWQYGRAIVLAGLAWLLVWGIGTRMMREPAAARKPGGRGRRVRRALRAWLRASVIASVPCAASVGLYAVNVLPSTGVMAATGAVIALGWLGARIASGRDSIYHYANHLRTVIALTAAAAVIGAMY